MKLAPDHIRATFKSAWQNFASAMQFLTIIPFGGSAAFDARKTIPFFPLAGLLIGACVAAVNTASEYLWSSPVSALLDVVALAIVSGALHLDGLADTADGLYGRRTPEQALAIMKDSRVGSIGVVVVVCVLAVKWAGIAGIEHNRLLWLLLVPAYSRSAVLFGIRWLPYGRPEGGTGFSFFEHVLDVKSFWCLGLVALLSLAGGWGAIGINLSLAGLVVAVLSFYRSKIGCITGDMLGAMIEIVECGLFLIISAWGG